MQRVADGHNRRATSHFNPTSSFCAGRCPLSSPLGEKIVTDRALPASFTHRTDWPGTFRFHYRVNVGAGGAAFSAFSIKFLDPDNPDFEFARFSGAGGGLTFGDVEGDGTASFHIPLEAMQGWDAVFHVQGAAFAGGGAVVEMTAMDGRAIGTAAIVGGGLGVTIFSGKGSFEFVRPTMIVSKLDDALVLGARVGLEKGERVPFEQGNGSPVRLGDSLANFDVEWRLAEAGDGYFLIVNEDSGKVLEIGNFDDKPGAPLQMWDRNGGDNQLWFFARRAEDDARNMVIVNKHSQLAIDIADNQATEGVTLQQWTAAGQANQQWRLAAATGKQPHKYK